MRTLEGHTDGVVCLNYNKGTLASGSADGVIKIWNIATGDCYALRGHQGWVNSVLLWDGKSSPLEQSVQDTSLSISAQPSATDSKSFLFSASDDGTIKLWDLHQRACIKTFVGHTGHVQSMKLLIVEKEPHEADEEMATHRISATNYSGASLSTDSGPSSCYSPSVATFRSASRLTGPSHMQDLTSSPDTPSLQQSRSSVFQLDDDKEAILVSGGLDNMIKIWDAATGMEKRTLFGYVGSFFIRLLRSVADELNSATSRVFGASILIPCDSLRALMVSGPAHNPLPIADSFPMQIAQSRSGIANQDGVRRLWLVIAEVGPLKSHGWTND